MWSIFVLTSKMVFPSYGHSSRPPLNLRSGPRYLPQNRSNTRQNQIRYGEHDRQFDNQNRDAEQYFDDAKRDAGRRQHQGNADREYKNSQKNDAYNSQYVSCVFHRFTPSLASYCF